MTPTTHFWDFIKPICLEQEGIVYVAMSDGDRMDRFTAASVSTDVYPGVFVMRPRYRVRETTNGLTIANFDVKLYILEKGDLSDYESQDQAFEFCEKTASQIVKQLNRLYLDEKACWFDLNDVSLDPVMYVTLDSAWGYELTIRVGLTANEFYN
ncbi:hypothetical protein VB264_16825 [Arcicella aquatica]|uniref:Uncharacterized protein n=1 Tax=Arcicella aquatica TaxID=217141 RepID=A0ABU5QQW0_9BACT|nr:hypothetical protein [Arcicella aquatica]MEA5259466.1 hypothetical protein [Arcicella aquatica]